MTIFERERYEAKKEGFDEGIKQGIDKGIKKGKLEDLHKCLSRMYPERPERLDSQLDKLEDISQVEKLFEMALDSSPLEDIVKYADKFIDVKPAKKRGKRAVAV